MLDFIFLTDCLTIKGVYLLIVVTKYIWSMTKMKGTIIKISSSSPGVNIIPHCKSSYTLLEMFFLTSTPKVLKDDKVRVSKAAITKVIM
jgi:hypothetical protein